MLALTPPSTLFPYTTLFRSRRHRRHRHPGGRGRGVRRGDPGRVRPRGARCAAARRPRSEEHTSELQSRGHLVCRLLLEKKKKYKLDLLSYDYMKKERDVYIG